MYTILNIVLGPEIMVTMIVNESQKEEVIDFMHDSDCPAVDLIEEIEAHFDARAVSPELVDPFNWVKAGEPFPATKNELSYVVSILDDQNNPSDNLDNFDDLNEAIAYAKEHEGAGVFQEHYLIDKNVCEYLLVWNPRKKINENL